MKPHSDRVKIALAVLSMFALLLGTQSRVGVPWAGPVLLVCSAATAGLFVRFAPRLLRLSPQNPKLRVVRLTVLFLVVLLLGIFVLVGGEEWLTAWLGRQQYEKMAAVFALGMIGIFVLVFGNLSPRIPFNRYMGLRLPWTVTDEPTWRVAHRMLGWLAWPCGLLQLVAAVICPPALLERLPWLAALPMLVWFLLPSLYSLWYFCRRWQVGPRWLYRRQGKGDKE